MVRTSLIATQLNVALTESDDTPVAGQNYILTCAEASGGRSMHRCRNEILIGGGGGTRMERNG